jgi:DNA-binding CsgD family transcriptional regulator
MREVSVRMLHLLIDLARTADVDEIALTDGLPSVALRDGEEPDWIDWDDFVELIERFERAVGGPEGVARAVRAGVPIAYPDLRAFAAVFVRPIPFFSFVMTRMALTIYRHLEIEQVERLGDDRIKWTQRIPEHYRPSEAFHRLSVPLVEVLPRHLELPEAKVEHVAISSHSADFIAKFPPAAPIAVRGARAVSSAASVIAVQFDEVFAKIAETLRKRPAGAEGATPVRPLGTSGDLDQWPERLALSPRQRDVFALLVEGRANKDIAAVLHCSERNVEFHVGRILRAAGVSSRAELLVKVLGART